MKTKPLLKLTTVFKCLALTSTIFGIVSCGGGGGISSDVVNSTSDSQNIVTVTPALGALSSGATVKAMKPDGSTITSSKTDTTGSATLNLGTYSGPMTLAVSGGTGVTYFDEKSSTNLPFGSTDTLLSVVPSSAVTTGASYGVTALTNMAAAFAGVSTNGVISGNTTDTINTNITNAVAKTQLAVGIPADQINILSAPKAVSSTNSKLSGSGTDVKYGLVLAELAKSSTGTALTQAKGLATSATNSLASPSLPISGSEYTQVVNKINSIVATPSNLGNNFLASGATLPTVNLVAPKTTTTSTEVATTATTVTTTTNTVTCAQAGNFPDVSLKTNYIDKNLDGKTNWDSNSSLKPSVKVTCSNGVVSVVSNGVPNFDSIGTGKNGTDVAFKVNNVTWKFPQNPTLASTTTSLKNVLGPVAVLINGVQIYGPVESPTDNYADPFLNGLLNYCGGHVDTYHFHSFPECFFNQNTLGGTSTFLPAKTPGVVLGYALDGFPILSPYEACTDTSDTSCVNGVKEIKSSYKYTGTGSYGTESAFDVNTYEAGYNGSTLDKCNGKKDAKGNYAYYATRQFPYYLACYSGTKTAQ